MIPRTLTPTPWSTNPRTSTLVRGDVYAVSVDGETVYVYEITRLIDGVTLEADTVRSAFAARLICHDAVQRHHVAMVAAAVARRAA